MSKKTELIVALDLESADEAMSIVNNTGQAVEWYKIGSKMFTSFGPELVRRVKDAGKKIFLDLKFHDIPNTVAGAVAAAARMGVEMVNVHASGGSGMMRAAVEAAAENAPGEKPLVIAVTLLTSIDAGGLSEIAAGEKPDPEKYVLKLAKLASDSGLDGIVCSAKEISVLRRELPAGFSLVVPGIRPAGSAKDDQKRIMTPGEAAGLGADFIVVGRPVIRAEDPSAAAHAILEELKGRSL